MDELEKWVKSHHHNYGRHDVSNGKDLAKCVELIGNNKLDG